jgi:hypothetical protein
MDSHRCCCGIQGNHPQCPMHGLANQQQGAAKMTLAQLADRLKCALVVHYLPEMEDPEDPKRPLGFIPDPRPWHVKKYDSYSSGVGRGATIEEACDGLADALIESARQSLSRDSESQSRSAKYLVELSYTIGKEAR